MATERLFGEHHLPEGMRIATNGGKTLDDFSSAIRAALRDSALASEGLASKIMSSSFVDDSDTPSIKTHTQKMNDITREEFNAKLETIEVKMDARVESVSAKIEAFMAVQAERDKRMEATVNQISANNAEIKSGLGSMKMTMVLTALSTVIAIVIGVASFNATLTSNMFSAFQAGKTDSSAQAPATGTAPPSNSSQAQPSVPAAQNKK